MGDRYIFDHEPAKFLVENAGLLPKGRVLDIAMGEGRNAVYLAKLGFEVEGVDISAEAVEAAHAWALENKVSIGIQTADLEKDYQIAPAAYGAIICFYYLQRSLIPQIKAGLQKGGVIIYETFIIDQRQFGHPRNPDFLLDYNELLNYFRDFRCLRYREGIIEPGKAVASLVAQKV
ncbi:MAG TPA: methyltransferase domain-containing protein [Dehalococcoidales bacterium]